HFSSLLGFTPQSLDPSIPVILFSIVFGLSMDYEVLLVSRMHEEYVRLGDNTAAVASGLEKTGRLITGAAAVMFAVFMAFGLAEVVIIKAIGIGLAIAVAIDATIVRSLVVPAVMRLLGDVNWWAPRPLRRLYDWIGIGERGVQVVSGVSAGAGSTAPSTGDVWPPGGGRSTRPRLVVFTLQRPERDRLRSSLRPQPSPRAATVMSLVTKLFPVNNQ